MDEYFEKDEHFCSLQLWTVDIPSIPQRRQTRGFIDQRDALWVTTESTNRVAALVHASSEICPIRGPLLRRKDLIGHISGRRTACEDPASRSVPDWKYRHKRLFQIIKKKNRGRIISCININKKWVLKWILTRVIEFYPWNPLKEIPQCSGKKSGRNHQLWGCWGSQSHIVEPF